MLASASHPPPFTRLVPLTTPSLHAHSEISTLPPPLPQKVHPKHRNFLPPRASNPSSAARLSTPHHRTSLHTLQCATGRPTLSMGDRCTRADHSHLPIPATTPTTSVERQRHGPTSCATSSTGFRGDAQHRRVTGVAVFHASTSPERPSDGVVIRNHPTRPPPTTAPATSPERSGGACDLQSPHIPTPATAPTTSVERQRHGPHLPMTPHPPHLHPRCIFKEGLQGTLPLHCFTP
mgnify:CR=1 FL=1